MSLLSSIFLRDTETYWKKSLSLAPHSSTLAWKIPWTEEPGGLQSMGVTKSQTQLSDFTFPSHFHALEKEMATHSSVLAWRIPGTGEPCGLPSMGSHRVGHDWSNLAAAAAAAGVLMVEILPSNAGGAGSNPRIPHAFQSKGQNIKQYCNKFNKDLKKNPYLQGSQSRETQACNTNNCNTVEVPAGALWRE